MRRLAPCLCLCLCLCLLPLPVPAQDDAALPGVAFVEAAEQYSGAVFGPDAAQTFARAVADCVRTGAPEQDCRVIAWCRPAGWAVDLFVQHSEGPHWHEFQCGLPDRATAQAVADALCDRGARPYLIECALVQLWSPEGRPQIKP